MRPPRVISSKKKPALTRVKGAQVPKVGRCQRRLSQKPKFVGGFWKLSLTPAFAELGIAQLLVVILHVIPYFSVIPLICVLF